MTAATTAFERILDKLEKVRRTGDKATALCPAHADSTPSLAITRIEGSVLIYCRAHCDTEPPWVHRRVCGLRDIPVGGRGSSLPVLLFELNRWQVPDR
jgi:hypothetical protein